MTGESRTFRVGQEVEVSYRARVVEVHTGSAGEGQPILRLEALDSHDYASPPGGWVAPDKVTVVVVKEPFPTEPGLYAVQFEETAEEHERHSRDTGRYYGSDGWEFFYLNTEGNWVDIGFGDPSESQAALLVPWRPLPF